MPSKASRLPRQETYTIEDLEQIKVLADPLRLRILEAFGEERTTKQVADLLGEKPTKLYHHVEALQRVGLIKLSRKRQNRGTVEKYFLAVARTFQAASRVFRPGAKGGKKTAAIRQMVSTIFDTTAAELAALGQQGSDATQGDQEQAIVSFLEIRASQAELDELRRQLQAVIEAATAGAEREAVQGQRRYRLTLAYFPLDTLTAGK